MKRNKKALSLVIALLLIIIMVLVALFILQYIVPFSKNTKGIEQSVMAYYQADSAIEEALYSLSGASLTDEKPKAIGTGSVSYGIKTTSSGTSLPIPGQGNSEFDQNYNIIKVGEPIQIEIGNNSITDFSNFKIYFKVPDLDGDDTTTEKFDSSTNSGIINWQLNAQNDTLNSSGSYIMGTDICKSTDNISSCSKTLGNLDGKTLSDSGANIKEFYSDGKLSEGVVAHCLAGSGCILKMSVINELKLDNGTIIPYLEWKIDAGTSIPLRYRIIDTTGRVYGFEKSLRVKIPQKTTNDAYDFAVFQ